MADPNDIVGKNDYQMGWAEQAELYRADDRTVMESGIAKLSYDEPQTTPSGETIWLRTSKVPLKNQHDEIIGLLGVYEDITERKRVEQQLFDSEAFTNSVLNSLASHIAVLDAQGMIIAVNNAWKQFAETNGLPEINHAMLGADYLAVCQKAFNQPNGEEANAVQYGISSVLAGDSDRFHLEYPCHSPTQQRWFYMTVSPLKGGQQGVVISHENITQRKQMEEALKASEARFRSIIDASPVPMALNDEQGNINYLNAAFVQTFGYDVTDIPTLPDWWTKAYPDPAYRLWVADTWQAALDMAEREHQPFAPQELNIYCKNGTQKTVLVSATAISESFHSLHLVVLYDITERKQAEAELKRSNAELEQFAYAVSHDMRQPLRMVTSYLSLIETALAPQLDEETQQFLTFALEGAKRMDAMILSLLDYSRVGRRTKPLALISSRAAVDEALAFLEPDTKASGGHIEVTGDWVELYASRDELTRLLQNLIGNALKYHEENKPPYVEVRATVTANTFKVAVRDSGIGIDPSQIDRLFKVFSRLQMRTRFEGTGVGLALCRKIVEHHGGQIGVESAGEGQGSVFWFELPLSQSSHTRET